MQMQIPATAGKPRFARNDSWAKLLPRSDRHWQFANLRHCSSNDVDSPRSCGVAARL